MAPSSRALSCSATSTRSARSELPVTGCFSTKEIFLTSCKRESLPSSPKVPADAAALLIREKRQATEDPTVAFQDAPTNLMRKKPAADPTEASTNLPDKVLNS